MKIFMINIILSMIMPVNNTYMIDFGQGKDGADWIIVNDGVMGGLSLSSAALNKNSLVFKGTTSLKNNGGFASVRGPLGNFDLSKYSKVKIKYRSTIVRNFSLRLGVSEAYYKPSYKHNFSSSSATWKTISFSLSDFQEYTLGRITNPDVPQEKFEDIIRIGLILSDKKEGAFNIEIDYIEFS